MHRIKENGGITDQSLWNEVKAMLKGKFIALNWESKYYKAII